jgi:hypothetical protein
LNKVCGERLRAGYAILAEIAGGSLIGQRRRPAIPDRPAKASLLGRINSLFAKLGKIGHNALIRLCAKGAIGVSAPAIL